MFFSAAAAASLAQKSGIGGAFAGLFGGAARDRARDERAKIHLDGALRGNVASAQRIIYGQHNTVTADRKRFDAAWAQVQAAQPAVAAKALALGPRSDDFGNADSNNAASELEQLRQKVQTEIASAIQRLGAGAVNAATEAIAPPGSDLNQAVTIPTSKSALVAMGLAAAALLALVMRRKE